MAVELIGLTPISPVMDDVPVFEIPDFARIAKLQAEPRSTEVAPITPGTIAAVRRMSSAMAEKKENFFLAVFIMPIEFCSMGACKTSEAINFPHHCYISQYYHYKCMFLLKYAVLRILALKWV